MLDDFKILQQHDCAKDLDLARVQYEQTLFNPEIFCSESDGRKINNIVVSGMGGSALSALLVKSWLKLDIKIPFEIIKMYDLPASVNKHTLFIASSYSGNTEETVSCLEQAKAVGAQIAIIASGGKLIEEARRSDIAHIILPDGFQPRMAMIYTLCAMTKIFGHFDIVEKNKITEISETAEWLKSEIEKWIPEVPTRNNYAKQLAHWTLGKTAVFFSGSFTYPVAYKFKTCANETAKNLSFLCEYPEFNHNEILGWTSHPIEKPFACFDVISGFEHPQILKRFEISDRLLSGKRPKSTTIVLEGQTQIAQLLWGSILADFVSIYLSALNGVNPISVGLIEKLKIELIE
jgi:glucose/mannose-6-phosphate isomerase